MNKARITRQNTKRSFFPIIVKYTGEQDTILVQAPGDLKDGKTFRVLATEAHGAVVRP